MSIHTFELTKELTHSELKEMKKHLRGRLFPLNDNQSKIEVQKYSNFGIRIYLMNHKHYPCIRFVVNPTEVLENGNVTDIFGDPDKLDDVVLKFDTYVSGLLGKKFVFSKLKLTRVDLCKDLQMSSRQEVHEYIHLLYKSNTKKGYKIKGRRCGNYDRSLGFACDNPTAGIGISVYDKKAQLQGIGRGDAAERVGDRLRVEVQLNSQKSLSKYCESDNIIDRLKYFLSSCQMLSTEILNKLLIDADYYTLSEAIDIVRELRSGKIRDRMIRLLELTCTHHSVRQAVKALKAEIPSINDKYVKILLQNFHDINVNVVTLGRRSNVHSLRSLLAQI